eukprot:g43483.t1
MGDAPEVGPPYKLVTDPEDSVFYATCYLQGPAWQFAQDCPACKPPEPSPDFRFGRRCISCGDLHTYSFEQPIPRWHMADQCEPCLDRPALSAMYADARSTEAMQLHPSADVASVGQGHRVSFAVVGALVLLVLIAIILLGRKRLTSLSEKWSSGFDLLRLDLATTWAEAAPVRFGLWRACVNSCVPLQEYSQDIGAGVLDLSRACACLAFLGCLTTTVLLAYTIKAPTSAGGPKLLQHLHWLLGAVFLCSYLAMGFYAAFSYDVLRKFAGTVTPKVGQGLNALVWLLTMPALWMIHVITNYEMASVGKHVTPVRDKPPIPPRPDRPQPVSPTAVHNEQATSPIASQSMSRPAVDNGGTVPDQLSSVEEVNLRERS